MFFNKNNCLIFMISGFFIFSCGSKSSNDSPSPDSDNFNSVEDSYLGDDAIEMNSKLLFEELNLEIKKLKAELEYYNESLGEVGAQSKLWANPFAIYNKEIVLNNGSSIYGKIIYQDQDVMKLETLIGELIVNRQNIVRVVNNVAAYGQSETSNSETSGYQSNIGDNSSGIDLVQQRIQNQSANLVLVGDIQEEKDNSGNTILRGEIKNVGNKRADFAKIIFTFRLNWEGDTKSLTAFITGTSNTFNTGISSDNSVLPHAVGQFEIIIPASFGSFIGYSYDIDWSQYEN